jgi:hypothetical protein
MGEKKVKGKANLRKASKISVIAILCLMFAAVSAAVYAQTQVSVYIRNPLTSDVKGVVSSGYWWEKSP